MKRIWIALALLGVVATVCIASRSYLRHQMGQMLDTLDQVESLWDGGEAEQTARLAREFAQEYRRISGILDCYVAHNDLAQSQETAALLPALIRQGGEEELRMELARLREQIGYLRIIDDPLPENIL